jgi:hypothetical protein
MLVVLMAICIPAIGCAGGNTPTPPASNPNGTPAGAYSYTVTATSGAIVHTEAVTLTVQ